MNDDPQLPSYHHQPTEEIIVPDPSLQAVLQAATVTARAAGSSTLGIEHVVLTLIGNPQLWPHEKLDAAGYSPEAIAEALVTRVILRATN